MNLATDKDGIAVLPELSPGRYFIGSLPVWNRNAEEVGICIIPCPDEGLETVDFVTDSLNGHLRPIDRDESALKKIWMDVGAMGKRRWLSTVRAAEQVSNTESLLNFRGVVQDRTGAVIPHAWIDVLVKGTEGEKHAALVRSDDAGAFSADLPDGDYIAVVSSPGFRIGTYRFCITAVGSSAALHVVLDVGAETEAVTVAISSNRSLPIPYVHTTSGFRTCTGLWFPTSQKRDIGHPGSCGLTRRPGEVLGLPGLKSETWGTQHMAVKSKPLCARSADWNGRDRIGS